MTHLVEVADRRGLFNVARAVSLFICQGSSAVQAIVHAYTKLPQGKSTTEKQIYERIVKSIHAKVKLEVFHTSGNPFVSFRSNAQPSTGDPLPVWDLWVLLEIIRGILSKEFVMVRGWDLHEHQDELKLLAGAVSEVLAFRHEYAHGSEAFSKPEILDVLKNMEIVLTALDPEQPLDDLQYVQAGDKVVVSPAVPYFVVCEELLGLIEDWSSRAWVRLAMPSSKLKDVMSKSQVKKLKTQVLEQLDRGHCSLEAAAILFGNPTFLKDRFPSIRRPEGQTTWSILRRARNDLYHFTDLIPVSRDTLGKLGDFVAAFKSCDFVTKDEIALATQRADQLSLLLEEHALKHDVEASWSSLSVPIARHRWFTLRPYGVPMIGHDADLKRCARLCLQPGHCVLLCGRSGIGKTMLATATKGILTAQYEVPTDAIFKLDGHNRTALSSSLRRYVRFG